MLSGLHLVCLVIYRYSKKSTQIGELLSSQLSFCFDFDFNPFCTFHLGPQYARCRFLCKTSDLCLSVLFVMAEKPQLMLCFERYDKYA